MTHSTCTQSNRQRAARNGRTSTRQQAQDLGLVQELGLLGVGGLKLDRHFGAGVPVLACITHGAVLDRARTLPSLRQRNGNGYSPRPCRHGGRRTCEARAAHSHDHCPGYLCNQTYTRRPVRSI